MSEKYKKNEIMENYTAIATVDLYDKNIRRKVFESLKKIGYEVYEYHSLSFDPKQTNLVDSDSTNEATFVINRGIFFFEHTDEADVFLYHYPCSVQCNEYTDTEEDAAALFLELAGMKKGSVKYKRYKLRLERDNGVKITRCETCCENDIPCGAYDIIEASQEQIAQAVKDKIIKL